MKKNIWIPGSTGMLGRSITKILDKKKLKRHATHQLTGRMKTKI